MANLNPLHYVNEVFGHGQGTLSGEMGKDIKKVFGHGPGTAAGAIASPSIPNPFKSKPAAPTDNPYSSLTTSTPQDIFGGHVDLSHLPYNIDTKNDKNFIALQKSNPDIAAAIQQRRAYDWQQLQQQMSGAGNNGIGAGVANPMAVQMLYQSLINPMLSNLQSQEKTNTDTYQNMMNQVLGDKNLPSVYRSALSAQVPQNVANMNQMSSADLQSALSSPTIAALLNQLSGNTQAQQARQRYDVMYGTGPGSSIQGQTGVVGGGVVLTNPLTGQISGG